MSDTAPQIDTAPWDLLVLSPHLDDGALSCGGEIHHETTAGGRVLVLTVFTADPPPERSALAEEVHRQMGLGADAMTVRRREDEIACARLGAEHAHWPFLDAIYRSDDGRPRHTDRESLFGEPAAADLVLAQGLQGLLRTVEARRILVPLGVGGHVDHRLVHRAASAVWGERVVAYEDFPYVRRWRALTGTLRRLGGRGCWRSETVTLTPSDVAARIDACRAYGSQVPPLFGDERRLARRIRHAVRRRGGERRWFRVAS